MKNEKPPNILEYFDFRLFLGDWYSQQKDSKNGLSFSDLSKKANLKSHSHYFDILNGRPLSKIFILKYCTLFDFNPIEAKYFVALVNYNQENSIEIKYGALQTLLSISPQHNTWVCDHESLEFFNGLEGAILLQLLLKDPKQDSIKTLANSFSPKISEKKLKETLAVLESNKIISWDKNKSEWAIHNKHLNISDTGKKMILKPHHLHAMKLGKYHYENSYDDQNFSTLTLGTSYSTQEKIEKRIAEFRRELVELVKADPKVETVVQVNFQNFNPTKAFHPRSRKSPK